MEPQYSHLSYAERIHLENGLRDGRSLRFLAQQLERSPSTLTRELSRNRSGPRTYRSDFASQLSGKRSSLPRVPSKLTYSPLWKYVLGGLRRKWSPSQIESRLKDDFPTNPQMRVSHETIYRSLYILPRGGLRSELLTLLRQSRKKRRPRSRGKDRRGVIPGMVSIHDRPAEVEDRIIPGHWEGDLIKGKGNASAIGTIVERKTRFLILVKMDGTDAQTACKAFVKRFRTVPQWLRKSMTYDRGREMAKHKELSEKTKIKVYFADPHSPWQRGTNENTNGLLRQYFPKGTPLNGYTQRQLNRVADEMNGRPRKTLNWKMPHEVIDAIIINQPVALGT
jgi:transposase, IS30 family